MNLDFSEDQQALRDQLRRFLAERCQPSAVRAVIDSDKPHDPDLYAELAEMGILGAAIPEEYGGAGLSHLELCVAAEELGRVLAPVPIASSVYLAAETLLLAGSEEQKATWLPRLASGRAIGTLACFEDDGRLVPAGVETTAWNGSLTGAKGPVADGSAADFAIVLAADRNRLLSLYLVDMTSPGVNRTTLCTIDPSRDYARLSFTNVPAQMIGGAGDGWHILTQVFDRAATLIAFEQLGGAERSLEMARDYALDRMAFGRQIGSFQAIKHMLADMYVAATLARSNCYYAAWALTSGVAELPLAAATARVSATQAFQLCARNNIQVHGGMGFTWEFDCHLYYRRSNALALLLGSQSTWESLLIERMSGGNAAVAA